MGLCREFFQKGVARLAFYLDECKMKVVHTRLPKRIILVRHGQSVGNVNHCVYGTTADNALPLTPHGEAQAEEAGRRIHAMVGNESVMVFVSPYVRTLQTCERILKFVQCTRVEIDPRLHEQEFGNMQDPHLTNTALREKCGRFWYRFPTGESGADVYHRTASFLHSLHLDGSKMHGDTYMQNIVIISHGLTMRLLLMAYFSWSPNTFETVWNPDNCALWVLERNAEHGGKRNYAISARLSDPIRSSKAALVTFKDGTTKQMIINDYLSIPQPRSMHPNEALQKLGLDPASVASIEYDVI